MFPYWGRYLPYCPRSSFRIGAALADHERAAWLRQLATRDAMLSAASPSIYVATPRRFTRPDRLARARTALTNLLAMIDVAQQAALVRGMGARIVAVEHLPVLPAARLIFSHHTVEDSTFSMLREKGSEIWHFKTGDLPNSVTLDPMGFSGWSSLAGKRLVDLDLDEIDQHEADVYFSSCRDAIIGGNISKYPQKRETLLTVPQRPYVFVAMQTLGDMVQNAAYIPMLEMLRIVVDRFRGTQYSVVVKRHPKCHSRQVFQAIASLKDEPHVKIVDLSIHQILARASALITVNSGVGSEAMLHRVPIYCFGAADYAPIAHRVISADEFRSLTDPIRPVCSNDELSRFHHFYRLRHQAIGIEALRQRVEALVDRYQKD